MRVLVTDGRERAALAVVRSLGAAGHEVDVVASVDRCLAGASRFAVDERRVPDPLGDPDRFARAVRQAATRQGADVLVPVSEASLHAVLPHRDAFGDVEIPWPDHEVFDAVCDKAQVQEVARDVGIAVPRQVTVETPAGGPAAAGVDFPVVVKPSRSVIGAGEAARKTQVRHARDERQLVDALEKLPAAAYPVLVQERVEGPGTGMFLLVWDGRLVAAFCHRRIREKPPSGGVSVLRESVPLDRDMLEASRELLGRFGWRGVAMVEFKRDRRTGIPYLMEINGRFWGSLQLAVDAGVDFPRLLLEVAAGESPEPVLDYDTGVRTRWFLGDVDHLLARLRHSREELGLAPHDPGVGAVLAGFLSAFGPGSRNEVFRWTDPRPAVREAAAWIRDATADGRTPASSSTTPRVRQE